MFSFGKKKQKSVDTPLGAANAFADRFSAPWRYRGVLMTVEWLADKPAPVDRVRAIQADFDAHVAAASAHLGFADFPRELATVVPDTIDLTESDADWSLWFRCAEWLDAHWGVAFRDGKIIRDFAGD